MRNNSDNDRLSYLLDAYINNTCSREEMEELFLLIDRDKNEQLLPVLQTQWVKAMDKESAADVNWELLYGAMVARTRYLEAVSEAPRRRRIRWSRSITAVLALLLLSVWTLFYFSSIQSKPVRVPVPVVSRFKNDVPPGGNKAMLTLSDGSSIVLDSANDGTLSVQGNTKVVKLASGRLAYQTGGHKEPDHSLLFNTISTPKGGQYQVVLPDGSRVWLDASSSIRFPTAFNVNERKVELSGEAYFEVTANPQKPFIVSVLSQQKDRTGELQKISVLGTRFNVMAYADESTVTTTLLDGAVEVAGGTGGIKLAPGEQAQLARNERSNINVIGDADVDAAVAWKNGYFDFNRADIHTVMRQLSRWYDVNVVYQGNGSDREFYGGMQRDLSLAAVFRILEKSGVEFSIDGKTVVVNL